RPAKIGSWYSGRDCRCEQATRARKPRHHSADWQCGDLGDGAVIEVMYFPKYQDLAERRRQRCHRLADLFGFQLCDQRCLGCLHLLGRRLLNLLSFILIEVIAEYHVLGSVLGKPAITRIAYDRQYPGARVSAAKPTNVLEGPH